jgi:hypothetical protein
MSVLIYPWRQKSMRNNWVGVTLVAHGEAEAFPTQWLPCTIFMSPNIGSI